MTTHVIRKYNSLTDFDLVRDFFFQHYPAFPIGVNWRFERWNYARYFVVPLAANLGQPQPSPQRHFQAVQDWEGSIQLWTLPSGKLMGLVHSEAGIPGEAFIQRCPGCDILIEDLIDYAEENFRHPEDNTLRFHVYQIDQPLQSSLQQRGYTKSEEDIAHDSLFTIADHLPLPQADLPDGFNIQTMADDNDLERRRKALGMAFGHEKPQDWPSLLSYRELQKAPDYNPENDFNIAAPDGEYAACAILWPDDMHKVGVIEPVGTHPEYRRQGFGRQVIMAAIRRAADLGLREVWVGSGLPFYLAIGFQKKFTSHTWEKTF